MPTTTETGFDRDSMARRYAEQHSEIDFAVDQIHYLPTDAPAREIRLLEVNRMIAERISPEPFDFGVCISGPDAHTLNVLDVTPSQWEEIHAGRMPLPAGWNLDNSRRLYLRAEP